MYNSLIAEAFNNSFGKLGRKAFIPRAIYQNTHSAKKGSPVRHDIYLQRIVVLFYWYYHRQYLKYRKMAHNR